MNEAESTAFRCVRCDIPATDQAESIVQPGVLLTIHLPMTDAEGRTVEWCRQHGGPVKPAATRSTLNTDVSSSRAAMSTDGEGTNDAR